MGEKFESFFARIFRKQFLDTSCANSGLWQLKNCFHLTSFELQGVENKVGAFSVKAISTRWRFCSGSVPPVPRRVQHWLRPSVGDPIVGVLAHAPARQVRRPPRLLLGPRCLRRGPLGRSHHAGGRMALAAGPLSVPVVGVRGGGRGVGPREREVQRSAWRGRHFAGKFGTQNARKKTFRSTSRQTWPSTR